MSDAPIPDRIGPRAVSVATGADWTLLDSLDLPNQLEAFLTDFGASIDQSINANYVEFQVRYNGAAMPRPFNSIPSQFGQANAPYRFPVFYPIGRGGKLAIYVRILTGAPASPTVMAATLGLVYQKPGRTFSDRRAV